MSSSDEGSSGKWDYWQAYSRNIGLLTREEQEKFKNLTVGIPGLGGVGGVHLITLARLGVGAFKIADKDEFSISNFNRQYGAFISTVDKSKSEVMERFVSDINPEMKLTTYESFINGDNIDEFLDGCDIIVDSLDAFSVDARMMLFSKCQSKGIPVISAGPIGFSASMIVITPDSMNVNDYFNISQDSDTEDKFLKFMVGLTPKPYFLSYMNTGKVDMSHQAGPSLSPSVSLCSGFATVELIKLVLGKGKVKPLPHYHYFDPFLGKFKVGWVPFGNRNWIQRLKLWYIRRFKLPGNN